MLIKHYNIIGRYIQEKNIFYYYLFTIVNEELLVIQEIGF
jgi:hypothetical protein